LSDWRPIRPKPLMPTRTAIVGPPAVSEWTARGLGRPIGALGKLSGMAPF